MGSPPRVCRERHAEPEHQRAQHDAADDEVEDRRNDVRERKDLTEESKLS